MGQQLITLIAKFVRAADAQRWVASRELRAAARSRLRHISAATL
jgi:hypothetical protein